MWLGYCQEGLGWDVRGDPTENRGWEEQGEAGMRFPTPTGIGLPTGDMAQASQCCWCKQSWQEPWQGACVTRGTAPSLAPPGHHSGSLLKPTQAIQAIPKLLSGLVALKVVPSTGTRV